MRKLLLILAFVFGRITVPGLGTVGVLYAIHSGDRTVLAKMRPAGTLVPKSQSLMGLHDCNGNLLPDDNEFAPPERVLSHKASRMTPRKVRYE